jgi:hypothetical protein
MRYVMLVLLGVSLGSGEVAEPFLVTHTTDDYTGKTWWAAAVKVSSQNENSKDGVNLTGTKTNAVMGDPMDEVTHVKYGNLFVGFFGVNAYPMQVDEAQLRYFYSDGSTKDYSVEMFPNPADEDSIGPNESNGYLGMLTYDMDANPYLSLKKIVVRMLWNGNVVTLGFTFRGDDIDELRKVAEYTEQ